MLCLLHLLVCCSYQPGYLSNWAVSDYELLDSFLPLQESEEKPGNVYTVQRHTVYHCIGLAYKTIDCHWNEDRQDSYPAKVMKEIYLQVCF